MTVPLPPHRGHELLARFALTHLGGGELTILVRGRASDAIPVERRAAWLRELCPGAVVTPFATELDLPRDDPAWASLVREHVAAPPRFLYSSEPGARALAKARSISYKKATIS